MSPVVALAIIAALLIYALADRWAADREDQRARQAASEAAQRAHEKRLAGVK